jgi:DNA replication protein DnaC
MLGQNNNTDKSYIEEKMKQFRLVDMRERYEEVIDEAEQGSISYTEFLVRLLSIEADGKMRRRSEKLTTRANFEKPSKLDDIDYGFNPSLNKTQIDELGELHFLDAHENIIIIGPPGVGKSMIATGIGMKACNAGRRVLFVNAKELVDRLCREMESGRLQETMDSLNRIELLIIDELSYIKMDKEKESLFFQIIRQRYERHSLIITTNLPMGRWDELFTGQLAATAILDRLLHHCHVISITGDSYRVKGSNLSVKKEGITE